MARRKIVAGNWKMNMTPSEAVKLVAELKDLVKSDDVDVVYCVPAIDIVPVVEAVKGTKLEGKLTFTIDNTLGNGFADALKANQVDLLFYVGWTGAALDPYSLMEAYTTVEYQYDPAWDTSTYMWDITLSDGVTYTASVLDWTYCMNGEKMPLADLGMGAVQIIMLLLRLATIISRTGNLAIKNTTFIVEEPEQNIHPKLQSKLADLFAYVNEKYGCQFVIETHSEYLIRRTQAMIATGEVPFEQNPFKVYYFPQEGQPYDMDYQKNGTFSKPFGKGFYDHASSLSFQVLQAKL